MEKTKLLNKIRLRKPLRTYGGQVLPAGAEITLTPDWETVPGNVRSRVILDPQGQRLLAINEELEYALGAH